MERLWLSRNVHPILLPDRWWSRILEPMHPPRVGEEILVFNTEVQGWFPWKITEEVQEGVLWTLDWWDDTREDRYKREEEILPFEETGWWYRIKGKTLANGCNN